MLLIIIHRSILNFLKSLCFQNNIYNILAAIAVMKIFIDISKLSKKTFFNFKIPDGRGDFNKIKIN